MRAWPSVSARALLAAPVRATRSEEVKSAVRAACNAALDVGVRRFDSSLGGLGGCPYAPGASGNVVTDDLVFMLEAMGLKTGVDLDQLLVAREFMERQLNDEPTFGAIANAGVPKGFVAAANQPA